MSDSLSSVFASKEVKFDRTMGMASSVVHEVTETRALRIGNGWANEKLQVRVVRLASCLRVGQDGNIHSLESKIILIFFMKASCHELAT